jgi:hypothetical protein
MAALHIRLGVRATSGAGTGFGGVAAVEESYQTGGTGVRSPRFTASDFCRLFHALIDGRMATPRRLLTERRDRDELDREPLTPGN